MKDDNLLVEIMFCFYCSYNLFIPNYTIMTYDNNATNIWLMRWIVTYQCRLSHTFNMLYTSKTSIDFRKPAQDVIATNVIYELSDTLLTLLYFSA